MSKNGQTINWTCRSFESLTNKELYQVFQLRINVFVVEQNCSYPDADGKDYDCYHLCGWVNGELAAYARLVPADVSYPGKVSIGRVVTSAKYRKEGLGKALIANAIDECYRHFGQKDIKISAQLYLKKFYEGFGFIALGNVYLEDDIEHIAMLKAV